MSPVQVTCKNWIFKGKGPVSHMGVGNLGMFGLLGIIGSLILHLLHPNPSQFLLELSPGSFPTSVNHSLALHGLKIIHSLNSSALN